MDFDFDLVMRALPLLVAGAGITVKITVMSVALGIIIGLIAGVARVSRVKPLQMITACYVNFFRGTPLLVQIFIIYFLLPIITGHRMDPLAVAITACGINSGIDTILVLSGESTQEDADNSEFKPTYIMRGIDELLEILTK